MSTFVAIRDGGKTNEEGAMRLWRRISSNGAGPILQDDLQVTQHAGSANTTVDINVHSGTPTGGDVAISYQNYMFHCWIDAVSVLTIAANASGNPRIDAVVAYVDLAVVSSVSNNNPGALKFMDVQGTPAGSPSAPLDAAIQTAVGAGNPFYRLAEVAVANGFPTSPSTIVNANLTDKRTRFLVGNSGAIPPFSVPGTLVVQTGGFMPNWIVPPGISAINRLDGTLLTAPVGSSLTVQLYNVTKAQVIGTLTFSAGSTVATNSSMTNAILSTSDVVRFDCTSVGSTTPGADVLVQPSA